MVDIFCDFCLWVLRWVKLEIFTATISYAEWIFWIVNLTKKNAYNIWESVFVFNRIAIGLLLVYGIWFYIKAYWYFYQWMSIAQEEVETEITVMVKMSI